VTSPEGLQHGNHQPGAVRPPAAVSVLDGHVQLQRCAPAAAVRGGDHPVGTPEAGAQSRTRPCWTDSDHLLVLSERPYAWRRCRDTLGKGFEAILGVVLLMFCENAG